MADDILELLPQLRREGGGVMGRSEITAGLSALLERRLAKENAKYAREVEIEEPVTRKLLRVDYMAYSYPAMRQGALHFADLGIVTVYEVKSCMADYRSGNGLGFYGDRNVLVCPSSLAEQLRGALPENVGVMCPVPDGRSVAAEMREQTPYGGETEGWELRKYFAAREPAYAPLRIPAVYALAQMVYAMCAHGDAGRGDA